MRWQQLACHGLNWRWTSGFGKVGRLAAGRGPMALHSSYSDGTLILTNRRLFFTGLSELDELPVFNFDEPLLVRCQRHGVFLNTLTVEIESGRRFEFRTKKIACKQIAARSQMRTVATSRSPVVRITPGEFRLSAGK